jgi:phosphatidylinositol glycan class K
MIYLNLTTTRILILCAFFVFCFLSTVQCSDVKHTNNWAVIVDTSRFWFNYRHAANALSIYRSVKRLGIPDR